MKPILLATNYSTASENAGDYAAQLAKLMNTSIIMLHTWTVPAMSSEAMLAMPDPEEFRRGEVARIEKSAAQFRSAWNVPVTAMERNGFAPEDIIDVARSQDVGLVVMGTHEHNLLSRIGGNTVTSLLHRAGFPMLLVPDGARYKRPVSILLASDNEHIPSSAAVATLKSFVHRLGTSLEVVNVQKPEHIWNIRSTSEAVRLEHSLRFCDHSWRFEFTENITEGIKHAAQDVEADWIAIAPRHFNWFQSLFHRSETNHLAFSCDLPLLVLPSTSD